MTVAEALKKYKISLDQWGLFLKIVQGNLRPPERKKSQRAGSYKKDVAAWMKTAPGWAYIGGMRDSLWAWVDADREAYDALEADLTKAAEKKIGA